jgi:hypothetical protein
MKIVPNCNYYFLNLMKVKISGIKSTNGELEFFTSFRLHRETCETLKKITPYVIRKYICDTY